MKTSTTTTPRSLRGISLLLGLAALGMIQPRAQAGILINSTTNNGSFETEGTDGFAAGWLPDKPYGGWRIEEATYHLGPPSVGTWYYYTGGATSTDNIRQTLTATLQPNTTYNLSVDIRGLRGQAGDGVIVELFAGETQLAWAGSIITYGGTYATGAAWAPMSLEYVSGSSVTPDQALQVRLTGGGTGQGVAWDNVQLTTQGMGTTPSTTALTYSGANPSTYGASLSFDVTVSGGAPSPSGTVTLKDGGSTGTTLGNGDLSNGICTIAITTLTGGDHDNIVAVYSGDSTYAGSTSSALSPTQTVNPATPIVTVTGSTSFPYNGFEQGPNTATKGGSSGALSFSYAGTGSTTYGPSSTRPTDIGTYTATATVAAETVPPINYAEGTSSATAFTIDKGNQAIVFTLGLNVVKLSDALPFIDSASGGASGNPVTYSVPSGEHGVATVDSGTGEVTIHGVGTAHILANQLGNDNYNAAPEVSQTLTVIAPLALPVNTDVNLWLDASQLTGLSDGDPVTTWTDMSGLGNDAAKTGGSPTYKTGVLNGKPVVRFVKSNEDAFTTADLSSQFPSAATVFIVTTINPGTETYTLVNTSEYGLAWEWWRYSNGNSYPSVFRQPRVETYCVMPDSGSHLFAISSSASAWEMWIDGTSQGAVGGSYSAGDVHVIGAGSKGGTLDGDIAEIIEFSRVLNPTEMAQMSAYLTTKYFGGSGGTTYAAWAGPSGYNLSGGADDDDDNDGVSNHDEYAFGLNPTTGTSVNPVTDISELSGLGKFTYTRTADTSPALAYTVWVSTDLADWGVAPAAATQVPRDPVVDGVETVDVTLDAYTPPPGGKLFVRVQAE